MHKFIILFFLVFQLSSCSSGSSSSGSSHPIYGDWQGNSLRLTIRQNDDLAHLDLTLPSRCNPSRRGASVERGQIERDSFHVVFLGMTFDNEEGVIESFGALEIDGSLSGNSLRVMVSSNDDCVGDLSESLSKVN